MDIMVQERRKESKYLTVILLLLVSVLIFFGYVTPVLLNYVLFTMPLALLIVYIIRKRYLTLTNMQILTITFIFLYALYQLIISTFSVYPIISTKDAIYRLVYMTVGVLFYLKDNWYKKGIKFFLLFSSIHTMFTMMQYLLPRFFDAAVLNNLPYEIQKVALHFLSIGVYSGITDQTGRNATYITFGLSVIYSKWLTNKDKLNIKILLPFAVWLLALLITGKRGHLIANIATMIIIYVYNEKVKGKNILSKFMKIMIGILIIISVIILIFPEALTPITRLSQPRTEDDSISVRMGHYKLAIEMFKQKPIIGFGTGTFKLFDSNETHTHNIYLQLLAENGMLGFTLFVSVLCLNILKTIKSLKVYIKDNKKNITFYLSFSLYIQLFFIIYGMSGNPISDNYILLTYLMASSIPFLLRFKESEKYLF